MTWFKVDDKLHSHRKAAKAGVEALGLWVLAGTWCADQLTDGFIPDYMALRMDLQAESHAAALVEAGLWDEVLGGGERGWQFHDWEKHQPTREQVEADRSAARERMRKLRAGSGDQSGSESVRPNSDRTSDSVRDSRPVPSSLKTSSSPDGDGFDEFWASYPRRVSKPQARKAWKAALKRASAEEIQAGLQAWLPVAAGKVAEAGGVQYLPHAATWLNGDRWADDIAGEAPTRPNPSNPWPDGEYTGPVFAEPQGPAIATVGSLWTEG